jgi:hypothetical protein
MDHKPYEAWLIADDPLLPAQQAQLDEHLKSCTSCRQLQYSWQKVEDLFGEAPVLKPKEGFTERWQIHLLAELSLQKEREQRRSTWVFLASTTGAAVLVLILMAISFFSRIQNTTEIFVSGMTLIAGLLNLTSAIQVAFFPLLEVFFVSVPTYWLLLLVCGACLLTLALTFSILRVLNTRRVSL